MFHIEATLKSGQRIVTSSGNYTVAEGVVQIVGTEGHALFPISELEVLLAQEVEANG